MINDASLVMIPSGYKDGKLYSVKPTDGSGDFTFSRGSNLAATRVNSEGLIEKGRENLLLQSNQFDTTWTTTNTSVTSGQSGYDGSNDAWLLNRTSTSGYIRQSVSSSNLQTISIYVKAGTLNWVALTTSASNTSVWFDILNGTVGTTQSAVINTNIESIGNGYYRCSVVINASISAFDIYPAPSNTSVSGSTGNIYIQDAQLEAGLVATDYIETTTTTAQAGILEDMPRLDYGSCPALLLEPQRSNLNDQSEYFNGWSKANATVTDNAIISPEGVENGSLVECTSGRIQKNISLTSGTTYVISLFAKANGDYFSVQVLDGTNPATQFNLSTESTSDSNGATSTIEEFGNGWYRCTMKFTSAYTGATTIRGITSTDTNGVYVYGWQIEAGSYPTSYIPTYGSSVTRSADSCSKTSATALIGQTEGVAFCEVNIENKTLGSSWAFSINDGTTSNYIGLRRSGGSELFAHINVSGTTTALIGTGITTGTHKIAIAYAINDIAVYVDGVSVGTDTSSGVPATSIIEIGDLVSNRYFDDSVKQFLLFKTRLTNDELAALTTL